MMGANLKGEESQQINLVGTRGLKNVMAITDGTLNIRGMVGNPHFTLDGADSSAITLDELLGEGEIQIVRSHPSWKHPMNGITQLRNAPIPVNLALYMAESEQRPAAMLTEVRIEDGQCLSALGVMVETLPGALEENIETSITNLGAVQKKGLLSYIPVDGHSNGENSQSADGDSGFIPTIRGVSGGEITDQQRTRAEELFQALDTPLDKILDDCLVGMDTGSIRWDRKPVFKCTCGVERVWRALKLLPRAEVEEIVSTQENVQVRAVFAGSCLC
jgi:redox-regulated HSP33 family molecular chaperone